MSCTEVIKVSAFKSQIMIEDTLSLAKSRVSNWWILLLLGVLFILFGIWTLRTPVASYITLSIFFGAFMFVSGLMELIFSLTNRKQIENWGWHLTGAVIDFLIGTLLLLYPKITMSVLPILVAFYFMFKGFTALGLSLDLKRAGADKWGWLMFLGIASLVFAVMIIFRPVIGGLAIVVSTGIAFLTIGMFKIFAAFALKSLKDKASQVSM